MTTDDPNLQSEICNLKSATRRHFFGQCGVGVGAIALNQLLARDGVAAPAPPAVGRGSPDHAPTRTAKYDPANPLGHLYLAIAFERTGEFERAVHVYEEAIQMNARTDQVYARLGKDELRLQHLDERSDRLLTWSRAVVARPGALQE